MYATIQVNFSPQSTTLLCNYKFNIFSGPATVIEAAGRWYSLIFLCSRMLFVCYFASNVYDESLKLLTIIHSVPSICYNQIIKRFLDHLKSTKIALSGMGLFFVTKPMILGVRIINIDFI